MQNRTKILMVVWIVSAVLLQVARGEDDAEQDGEEASETYETHLWSRLSKDHSTKREKRNTVADPVDGVGARWSSEYRRKIRNILSTSDLVDPADPRSPPSFEKDFDASVRVMNLHTSETYLVYERVKGDTVTLKMVRFDNDEREQLCTYSKASGFGHTIYGLECLPAVNLPTGCFCTSGLTPTPYLPLTDLLDAVDSKGGSPVNTNVTFRQFVTWTVKENNLDMTATFLEDSPEADDINKDKNSSLHSHLVPFSLRVAHNASNPQNYFSKRDKLCGEIYLEYTIQRFDPIRATKVENVSPEDEPENHDDESHPTEKKQGSGLGPMGGEVIQGTASVAPEGVFCQRPDIYRRRLPDMPDQFSVKIETVDEGQQSVTYSEQHYDVSHKLVSFKFAPRSHSPPAVFFARFILSSAFPNEVFYVVHDFQTQLQYTINERTGNCSVQRIPITASDVELQENSHSLRIKHAKELLDVDPKKFVYAGERPVRGIPVDVWVAEKPVASGYQTTEIYFSRHDWNILVEEVNAHQELPLGMAIYRANYKNASRFSSKVESHYIEFNPSQPSWKFFDVSNCMRDLDKLYLKLTLDVSYSQLVQFSLQRAHDSIRKAIAGISKVSPLRISDLHLSTTPGDKEGIDVWFVMLEGARLNEDQVSRLRVGASSNGMSSGPRQKELTVKEAYRHLGIITAQTDVTLRLQVSKEREMTAQVRRHSLQMAPESVHPSSHGRSGTYRFLRATYTAGSMAGLGFSMAILGVCIGLFLGFLLWKRRLGVPYQLTP